jgi:signal transduction histidine kinase
MKEGKSGNGNGLQMKPPSRPPLTTDLEQLRRLQLVSDAALAHLNLDELLAQLLTRIADILETDTCAVLLLDRENRQLVARAAVGIEEEVEQGVRIPLGRGFAGRVAAQRRPIVLPDVDHADVLNPILREKGIKSLLGVPLVVQDHAIGVLHVGTLSPRRFEQWDVNLLQLVADRVAIAIERARAHERALQLDEMKLNFVAVASHELRTPTASVYGVLATLDERWEDLSEEQKRTLSASGHEQAERLRLLLEQLLDLSRLDSRVTTIEPKPIVMRSLIGELVAQAYGTRAPEGVQLEIPDTLAAVADPVVIERVVSNLLVNASRYGRPPVVVSAEQRDQHLRIAVEDNGPGIPNGLEHRLFERFERGPEAKGSGLGLSIARAYARAHGGDVVYMPGRSGARFELVLPHA